MTDYTTDGICKSAPCVWFVDDSEDWSELETEVLF